jgi:hypothetical protein
MARISTFAVLGILAVSAGADLLDSSAADARTGNQRWCSMVNVGYGDVVETCDYATIEACRPHVIAGNKGFCNENPGYVEPLVRHLRKRHVKG